MQTRRTEKENNTVTEYLRVCAECGDEKWVQHKPAEGTLCRKCTNLNMEDNLVKARAKMMAMPKVRYYHFCPTCPTVTISRAKRKTQFCGKCSRLYGKRKGYRTYFDFETMAMVTETPEQEKKQGYIPKTVKIGKTYYYHRQCIDCGEEVYTKNNKKTPRCKDCGIEFRRANVTGKKRGNYNVKPKPKPKPKPKLDDKYRMNKRKSWPSEEFINKQRELNEAHRKHEEAKKMEVEEPKGLTEEEQAKAIEEFLKTNGASVVDHKLHTHFVKSSLGSGTSVLS